MKQLLFIMTLVFLAGCESGALETGYYPHKLTDTPSERQSYYASPFSPESNSNTNNSPDPAMRKPSRY